MTNWLHKFSTVVITVSTLLLIFPQNCFAAMSSDQVDQLARKVTVKITDDNQGNGSGVIVAKLESIYFVLTAEHVVETDQGYKISTPDGKSYSARYSSMVKLPNVDLAIVPFSSKENYAIAKLGDSNKVRRDNITYVAGFPKVDKKYRFTQGKVVAFASRNAVERGYTLVYDNRTDIGMSGGAVLNEDGEVIGVHGKADERKDEGSEQVVLTGNKSGIPANTFLSLLPQTKLALGFKVPTSSDNGATAIDDIIARAVELERRGDNKALLALTDQAINDGVKNPTIYFARGTARFGLGDNQGAINDYSEALRINPNDIESYNSRGNARQRLGDNQGAINDYNEALKINPNYAAVHNNRGIARSNLGDYQGAINDSDKALRINPNLAEAYNTKGNARKSLGDNQGAINDYNEALRINPNLAVAYYNLGKVYSLSDKKIAVSYYTQALKINPNYKSAYFNRGNVLRELGNKEEAIQDYNQALRIAPNDADAYSNRGGTRAQLGDKQGAIQDFRKAAELYGQQGNQAWQKLMLNNLRILQN